MHKDPFRDAKTGNPHSVVLWQGRSEFNGNVMCFEERGWRYLQTIYKSRFPTTQTAVKISNPLISKFKMYPAGLFISLGYHAKSPNEQQLLLIGVAGGFVVNYLDHFHPHMDFQAVEIDPVMVELAQKYFNVRRDIFCEDGARLITNSNDLGPYKKDIIMLDAFQGMYIPEVFNNDTFYQAMKKNVLAQDGVLAVNIVENDDTDSLVARIKSHFKQVDEFYQGGNLVLIASDKERDPDTILSQASAHQEAHKYPYHLGEMMKRFRKVHKPKPGSLF